MVGLRTAREPAMTDLTFYTNPMSRGRIVRWMLEEVGEPYETVLLDYGTTMKGADYLAINPMGKVPAIKHGDTVVTEARGDLRLSRRRLPRQRASRRRPATASAAPYYRWLFFAAGPVEAAVTGKALGLLAPADKKAMAGYGSFEDDDRRARDRARPGPYICGEQFTAADLYVGAQIGWGMMFGTIEKRPAFEDYFGRLQAPPGGDPRQRARRCADAEAADGRAGMSDDRLARRDRALRPLHP